MSKEYDAVVDGCKVDAFIVENQKPTVFDIDVTSRPVQKAIIGKKVGDRFKLPNIPLTYEILRIYEQSEDQPDTPITYKPRFFWVFQGKGYSTELPDEYLWAPYKDVAGHDPHHWARLELIKSGDLIIHGLGQCISAISVATGTCFPSKIKDGKTLGRQVNCRTYIMKNIITTRWYRDVIISSCSKHMYQPFDKNGDGISGYLFDLNDELAAIFLKALVEKNPALTNDIPELPNAMKCLGI